jgi:hypothetical protein
VSETTTSEVSRRSAFSLARGAVMFELRLYRSLFRWVTRRPRVSGPSDEVFTYARTATPVMWLWIFGSAVEMVVVHLLIPWTTVRIILLIVSAWGLIWMVGFLASITVYPHLLSTSGLRVRHGTSVDISIPWDSIDRVTVQRRDVPSSIRTLQPRETETGTDLQVGVSGEVNVHAVLSQPQTVPTPKGDLRIAELSFWVDEPNALVARARQHLRAHATQQDQPNP